MVEDAAHSFGARVNGRQLGRFGRATAFSFYATKNLTTAEGGAITTEDDALAQRLRLLGYHGMSRDSWSRYTDKGSWYYEVEIPGFKCNLSDLHAALGLTQLAKIDTLLERRRAVADGLTRRARGVRCGRAAARIPGQLAHVAPVRDPPAPRGAAHRPRRVHQGAARGEHRHIGALHSRPSSPVLPSLPARAGDASPRSDDYYARCISLPIFPDMTDDDVRDVAEAVTRIAEHFRAI